MKGCWPRSTPPPERGHDVARISDETRRNNETASRHVMERLLTGDIPPGGKCDIKTLATQAGVARTGFYPKKNRDGSPRPGPYQHLAEAFERRLTELRETGVIQDPRAAQIERLKEQVSGLKERSPPVTRRSTGSLTSGSGLCLRSPPRGWRSNGFAPSWQGRRTSMLCRTVQERARRTYS